MSTREERQAWQDFREKHGSTVKVFLRKWRDMFGRPATDAELQSYKRKRTELRKPLGRKAREADADDLLPRGSSPHDFGVHDIGRPEPSSLLRQTDTGVAYEKVELVTVTRRHEWDMAHRLPGHLGKCRRLHGHRYVAEIDVTGPLQTAGPGAGMVTDFDVLKGVIELTFGHWDHRTLLHKDDPLVGALLGLGRNNLDIDDSYISVDWIPTAENLAKEILSLLSPVVGPTCRITRVRVYETPNGWAEVKA